VRSRGFAFTLGGAAGPADGGAPRLSVWGDGSTDGSLFWGVDMQRGERWMAGVAMAETEGRLVRQFSVDGAALSGNVESDLSAVYPYMRGRIGNGLELWSLAGRGDGQLDSLWNSGSTEEVRLQGKLAFEMGLVGVEQELWRGDRLRLAALGDVGWARLAATGGSASGIESAVSRARFGLEGRQAAEGNWDWGLRMRGRSDGGDGETASGIELSGDFARSWERRRLAVDGRWHSGGNAFGAQGIRATFGFLEQADGAGFAFSVAPGWGTDGWEGQENSRSSLALPVLAAGTSTRNAQEFEAHLSGRLSRGIRIDENSLVKLYGEASRGERSGGYTRIGLSLEGDVSLEFVVDYRDRQRGAHEAGVLLGLSRQF